MIEDKMNIWIKYMVAQKALIHFRPWIKVPPERIQHWNKLKYPVLEIGVGTCNHPQIDIIPFEDFTDENVAYWKNIMKNENNLIKYDSACNIMRFKT